MSNEKNKCMNCDGPMPWPNDVCSNECQRELDGKSWEAQLDKCHDVMREVAESVRATADELQTRDYSDAATEAAAKLHEAAQKLDAARAGKAGAMTDDIEELKRLCAEAEAKWLSARHASDDLDAEASAWYRKMLEIERTIDPSAPPTPIQKMLNEMCEKMGRELSRRLYGNTKIAEEDLHDSDHPCGQRWCSVCQ